MVYNILSGIRSFVLEKQMNLFIRNFIYLLKKWKINPVFCKNSLDFVTDM